MVTAPGRKTISFGLLLIDILWLYPQKPDSIGGGRLRTRAACYCFHPRAREFHIFITDLGMFMELIFNSRCNLFFFYFLSFCDIFGSAWVFPLMVSWFHLPPLPGFPWFFCLLLWTSLLSFLEAFSHQHSSWRTAILDSGHIPGKLSQWGRELSGEQGGQASGCSENESGPKRAGPNSWRNAETGSSDKEEWSGCIMRNFQTIKWYMHSNSPMLWQARETAGTSSISLCSHPVTFIREEHWMHGFPGWMWTVRVPTECTAKHRVWTSSFHTLAQSRSLLTPSLSFFSLLHHERVWSSLCTSSDSDLVQMSV